MNNDRSKKYPAWLAAFLTGFAAIFILFGYEFIRSPSNTIIKNLYGKDILAWVLAVMPIGVILVLVVYNWLLSRLKAKKTFVVTCLGSGLIIGACYAALEAGFKPAAWVLFIFREAYIVLLIEQCWSFLNSTLNAEEGRVFNGPIAGIATAGALPAGLLIGQLAPVVGTQSLLLVAAASLVPAAVVMIVAMNLFGEPAAKEQQADQKGSHLGLQTFKKEKGLWYILIIVITSQVLSAVLVLNFQWALQDEIPNPDEQTAYSGNFFALVNGLACFSQFVIAPLLLRFSPFRLIQLLMPFINLITVCALAYFQNLTAAAAAYLLFKVLDYSLFRASKEIMYIPLSYDARYRAKEFIDVFGYRFSKGVTSLIIGSLRKFAIISSGGTVFIGLAAALVWMVFTYLRAGRSKD